MCINNRLTGPSTWTFGQVRTESCSGHDSSYQYQVLAMTVVIPSLVAMLSDLVENLKGFGNKDTTNKSSHTKSGSIPQNGFPEPHQSPPRAP
jgi:hypothetical protein